MGRIIKKRDEGQSHLSFMAEQIALGEKLEVTFGAGPRAFLWFKGHPTQGSFGFLTGRATLRALAHAILEAYPDEPKKGRK
jgi:hypothetical protein